MTKALEVPDKSAPDDVTVLSQERRRTESPAFGNDQQTRHGQASMNSQDDRKPTREAVEPPDNLPLVHIEGQISENEVPLAQESFGQRKKSRRSSRGSRESVPGRPGRGKSKQGKQKDRRSSKEHKSTDNDWNTPRPTVFEGQVQALGSSEVLGDGGTNAEAFDDKGCAPDPDPNRVSQAPSQSSTVLVTYDALDSTEFADVDETHQSTATIGTEGGGARTEQGRTQDTDENGNVVDSSSYGHETNVLMLQSVEASCDAVESINELPSLSDAEAELSRAKKRKKSVGVGGSIRSMSDSAVRRMSMGIQVDGLPQKNRRTRRNNTLTVAKPHVGSQLRRFSILDVESAPDNETGTLVDGKIPRHRSKRIRIPPLAWWAGEKIEYKSKDKSIGNAQATAIYRLQAEEDGNSKIRRCSFIRPANPDRGGRSRSQAVRELMPVGDGGGSPSDEESGNNSNLALESDGTLSIANVAMVQIEEQCPWVLAPGYSSTWMQTEDLLPRHCVLNDKRGRVVISKPSNDQWQQIKQNGRPYWVSFADLSELQMQMRMLRWQRQEPSSTMCICVT